MNWYLMALKKYSVFSGRSRRKEYWMFFLISILISFLLGLVARSLGMADDVGDGLIVNLYWLAILVPSIAVGIRRMHDTGHSGWWILVPIVNLIFALTDSEAGDNTYGPNPKAQDAT